MDTTPLFGIEYPEGTDPITDYPAVAQAAATTIEGLIAEIGPTLGADYTPNGAANQDLAAPTRPVHQLLPTASGGTIRSLGAGAHTGQRILLVNTGSTYYVTLLNLTAGGGPQIKSRNGKNIPIGPGMAITLMYDGAKWVEVGRTPSQRIVTGRVTSGGAIDAGTGFTVTNGGNTNTVNLNVPFPDATSYVVLVSTRDFSTFVWMSGITDGGHFTVGGYNAAQTANGPAGFHFAAIEIV